ncbi:putative glucanase GlgE domain protein [Mycobacterium xenopi 3993]|nr:putative glucanase GlgE domain protein [Mycobacterium xenopi 3993]
MAKLDAGQGETELSNDLLVGARLFDRAAAGVPRAERDPCWRPRLPCAPR